MEMNLRNIYKVNDVFYYDVVTYDKHLVDVSHSILNLKGLEQRLANCGDIKRDFEQKYIDRYLKENGDFL